MRIGNVKILWWIIALLAAFSLAVIATVAVDYCRCHRPGAAKTIVVAPGCGMSAHLFKSELGFDERQMGVFRQSSRTFRSEAGRIIDDINLQKTSMFEELQADAPDTVKLAATSREIGALHARLKDATVRFYLSLSEVCDAGQKEKLKNILAPLFIEPSAKQGNPGCTCEIPNIK
jgi:hypothetical protein